MADCIGHTRGCRQAHSPQDESVQVLETDNCPHRRNRPRHKRKRRGLQSRAFSHCSHLVTLTVITVLALLPSTAVMVIFAVPVLRKVTEPFSSTVATFTLLLL